MSLEEARRQNLKKNAEIFASFSFGEMKKEMRKTVKKPLKGRVTKRPKKKAPDRRSSRLASTRTISLNEDVLQRVLERESMKEYVKKTYASKSRFRKKKSPPKERKTIDRILLSDVLLTKGDSIDNLQGCMFGDISSSSSWTTHKSTDEVNSFTFNLKTGLRMSETSVGQVTPKQVTSLIFHPSADKALVIAGSYDGVVGFWNINESQNSPVRMKHHKYAVTAVGVHPSEPKRVITTSYDGILCVTDIDRRKIREAYATDETGLHAMDFIEHNIIMTGTGTGYGLINDLRARGNTINVPCLRPGQKKLPLKSISVHPVKRGSLIAIGLSCGDLLLWDMRNPNKFLNRVPQRNSVRWCEFSPNTGSRLLTCTDGDQIRIYLTNDMFQLERNPLTISHHNFIGRNVISSRPRWLANREDCFVTGSMLMPAAAEIFNALSGEKMTSLSDPGLQSIKPLWVYHPVMNILAGGDLLGHVHYFS